MKNRRISKIKRKRKSGFRARMKTARGRNTVRSQRRAGRTVNHA